MGDQTAFLGVLRRYGESIPLACISWLREGENAKKILDYPMGIELRTALTGLFYELDHVRRESPAASLHRIASRLHYFQYLQRVGERRESIQPDSNNDMISSSVWSRVQDMGRMGGKSTAKDTGNDDSQIIGCSPSDNACRKRLGIRHSVDSRSGRGNAAHERAEDLEEERRLLYVGCTRAKTRLILSRNLRRGGNQQSKSLFWTEIDEKRSDNL